MDRYLFTIVTVCYNAEKTICKTMKSVLQQSYKRFEYIIVDGASNDNTIKIINQFFDDRIVLISEKDDGIYDAMNKAIRFARGEYIIFMNSGDRFINSLVLEKLSQNLGTDIIYGNCLRVFKDKRILEKYRDARLWRILYLTYGKMICHQSIVVKTRLIKEHPFNCNYIICADRDFLAYATKINLSFKYIDLPISVVDNVEGLSSDLRNKNIIRKETDLIIHEYYKLLFYISYPAKSLVRLYEKICY